MFFDCEVLHHHHGLSGGLIY